MRVRLARPEAPGPIQEVARALAATGRGAWLTGEALADRLRARRCTGTTIVTSAPAREIAGLFERAVPIAPGEVAWQLPSAAGPVDLRPLGEDVSLETALRGAGLSQWALAWSPIEGEVVDPHDGIADLEAGRLRTTGPAADTLAREPTLPFQILRVCGQHGDLPDPELEGALEELGRSGADRCPAAIRGRTLRAMIEGGMADRAVTVLARSGFEHAIGAKARSDAASLLARVPADPAMRLVIWLRGTRPGRFLRRHRVHPELAERVISLLAAHPLERNFSAKRRGSLTRLASLRESDRDGLFWLREQELELEPDAAPAAAARQELERLRRALEQHLEEERHSQSAPALALDGRGVMEALQIEAGPWVGRALAYLRSRVADAPELNDVETLRAELREWWRTHERSVRGGEAAPPG